MTHPPAYTQLAQTRADAEALGDQLALTRLSAKRHAERAMADASATAAHMTTALSDLTLSLSQRRDPGAMLEAWAGYLTDVMQRSVLTLETLRKSGDNFLAHQAAGEPPLMIYDYETLIDGRDLPRPCNYMLLRLLLPQELRDEGVETDADKRPVLIIDPRAGHGPGIGGFKPDSQAGIGLRHGHPVYFAAFRPEPEGDQSLADVARAEAAFLREIRRHHPDAPAPLVIGNCQGGWATAILAALNPDLVGPIALNGAPMSYWSGVVGQDPMRYTGGIVGGVTAAQMVSDLGGGRFDGANLALNFELLNPGRNWFRTYYDLFAGIDVKSSARFLEFDRWNSGFFLLNAGEMRWLVDNLFIGNRLAANQAQIEPGRPIDLKAIRTPIIVFASHGDNITPPQQALNWIVDTYADETEIEICGQRILYALHEEVGHLGIFVSSAVARKEHTEFGATLEIIEALPPGLYELQIEDAEGDHHDRRYTVDIVRRSMADILDLGDGRKEEPAFAAVARMSEVTAEVYDATLGPVLRAASSGPVPQKLRRLHPLRVRRELASSANPAMVAATSYADAVRAQRKPAAPDNPFLLAERFCADVVELSWNLWRDGRELFFESVFLAAYTNPLAVAFGQPNLLKRSQAMPSELRALPAAQEALSRIDAGGVAEAVIRVLILIGDATGEAPREMVERWAAILASRPPFATLSSAERARLIREQTLIVRFEPEPAIEALTVMLSKPADRKATAAIVRDVLGGRALRPETWARINLIRRAFGEPEIDPEAPQLQASARIDAA
ncbi:MAG: DUF3141 domain-containing protein [Pseudomonadota bacterium]